MSHFETIRIETVSHTQMIDITSKVADLVRNSGISSGVCTVFIPHTTAGITLNENTDPKVQKDFLNEINKIVPMDDHYEHMEGNSAAHLKASLIGSSIDIIIEDNTLVTGTWQGIYFCEFDGPRTRKIYIKITEG